MIPTVTTPREPDRSQPLRVTHKGELLIETHDWDQARAIHEATPGSRRWRGEVLLSTMTSNAQAEAALRIEQGHAQPRSASVERALANQWQHRVSKRYRARTDAE